MTMHERCVNVEQVAFVTRLSDIEYFSCFRAKSPSFVGNPSLYSDALNASLQSALNFAGEGGINPFLSQSMAASLQQHHQREREAMAAAAAAAVERHHGIGDR